MTEEFTFGSLFTGAGGFDLGLELAGGKVKWQDDIDKQRIEILEQSWPGVKRYGDIRDVDPKELEPVDLVCGGFPCQDLSVAGKRRGLEGDRSGLFWEFIRVVDGLRPRWILVENVPGWFTSGGGEDYRVALCALDECGYGVAWRVLNSQFFGVPQRRCRIFIVGYQGSPCPPEVLFEPEGGGWDIEKGQETGQEIARAVTSSTGGCSAKEQQHTFIVGTISPNYGDHWNANQFQRECNFIVGTITGNEGRGMPNTKEAMYQNKLVCEEAHAIGVREAPGVPGWVDNNPPPDAHRYRALGDAVTVSVAKWIGERIKKAINSGG